MRTGGKFPANYFLQLFKAAPISIRKNENAGKQENPAFLNFSFSRFAGRFRKGTSDRHRICGRIGESVHTV
ncbi:MAG: hypothetical protein C6W56_06860 [Caldibacillus debilis]|nr:MAG: hypothetical protein C6W56_06860 [Caldibacillus debilis]